MKIMNATKEDARVLAYLANIASLGIPEFLWRDLIKANESPLDVGEEIAARENGESSYTNARICVLNNNVAGMVASYRQINKYKIGDLSKYPEVVQPFVKLEAKAPGSWVINSIATFEEYRSTGVATLLMTDTEKQAKANNCNLMSLIVASENVNAKRLYEHLGYNSVSSLPIVPYPGSSIYGDWILMTKQI